MNKVPSQSRYVHMLSKIEDIQKYRHLKIGVENNLETGFQTLLFLLESPALAGNLRHLEVHGTRNVSDNGLDVDFNRPPDDPRQLELDDLERLKAAIRRAGFIKGNESQAVLHMLLLRPHTRDLSGFSHSVSHCMAFKQALAALLIAMSPQLESIAIFHVGEASSEIENFPLLTMLQRANRTPSSVSIPYLQNLSRIIFLPDDCSSGNDGFYYNIAEDYYHRLNLVRRLPALNDISFTHSNLAENESEMCHIINSSKMLRKFTYTIGGRAQPEGGSAKGIDKDELQVEDIEYEEVWEGEMDELDMELETPPNTGISLADFSKLRSLSLGIHTLCFLARGIGPNWIDAKAFSLVHTMPASLKNLRLYGKGEKGDPTFKLGHHEPDLDVDALLENLVDEKDHGTKLPKLKTIEGFDPVIPRAKEVPEYADEDHPLLWKQL
ncbi:hypothetical protein N7493_009201 [Penicillium malachiteum]|uniref:Uncharacterized protein n=1 Tax=Penicillium malachiteum TaxID=1324776 RepID=A0AAD6HG18_9EURO|nr:hypothetical protein N7493_009201 [Penicillium malachiteum]